ncbi:MAG TPA: PIG-L family deacetylase [Puia sp.]|jgi:LmbE family N-acetylglucosaminyl deacetylase|nr:PIG-L family deacetylase [Puia sp.]
MNKVLFFFLAVLMVGSGARGQGPATVTSADIFLRLKKLNVLGTVLYVAAHPDDENSRLIAYMAKGRLYRTGYLSMTRGDGGQNLIGDEQGVELGLIRTQEMMAARRVDGAEQFFTRAYDFGFSKSTDEALKTWDHEKMLSDIVWVIRKFQPDVIITRFPPDSRAGHGHHSASALLAHEAFDAAADPNRFPEQLKYGGVKPWKAKRVLWNSFNFGPGLNTTSEDQMKIDVGGFNPILGKSYGELAAISRTNHKSQGAALTPARGESMEYFNLVAGDPAHNDPMEDVVTDWGRVENGSEIGLMVDQVVKDFSLMAPEKSVPGLAGIYKVISQLPDGYWKTQKLKEVRDLIADCSGLWLEAVVRAPYAVRGDSLTINFVVNDRLGADMTVNGVGSGDFDTALNQRLAADKNFFFSRSVFVSQRQPLTQPYWLEEPMSPGHFNVGNQLLIGDPVSAPAFVANFRIMVDGLLLNFSRPVQYKYTHPVKGEVYEPLTILPRATAQFDPGLLVFTDGEKKEFEATVQDRTGHGHPPALGLTVAPALSVQAVGGGVSGDPSWMAKPVSKGTAVVSVVGVFNENGQKDTAMELRTLAYDHIPRIDYFRPAEEMFTIASIKTSGHRIGYIEGAGDKVPEALRQMGYEVVTLRERELASASYLQQFDAIIAGVRAYDVHPWLTARHEVLMEYVKNGGNFVVQYNRGDLGQMKTTIGPYPFAVGNIRVTDELAKVNFALPDHKVLHFPNTITDEDFNGWIQERGIYFAGKVDTAYQEVLSMRDPGEDEQKGSLVIANYGKGVFVYTGLVFFRELPAGVPGAYRLMANIIALNHKKGF